MTTPIFNVKVRRDAHTTTPVQVPRHEIAILQTIFGEENVHNMAGRPLAGPEPVELTDADLAGSREINPAEEYDRLAAKYGGSDEGLLVEQVYGKKQSRALTDAIETAKAKAEKK